MSIEYRIGDVFKRLAEIPDGSIDLIVSSPPFLALRSYLPDDHPDKDREIGAEPTPAAFIDTQLALAAEYARVLAPHGSLCYEIGDTYSGSGNGPDALKTGTGSHDLWRDDHVPKRGGPGWPLAKSMCLIPHMFTGSLAYGRNLLTGEPSPAGDWRIRNVICWARPNPTVGALGDKFRPATSYITVACKSDRRFFDLDAVRGDPIEPTLKRRVGEASASRGVSGGDSGNPDKERFSGNPAGAPPLDWHTDEHPEDGDWLWKLSTRPYSGSHYAVFPLDLPKRLIEAMCPQRVCTTCGQPSERITERTPEYAAVREAVGGFNERGNVSGVSGSRYKQMGDITSAQNITVGWSDCGHDTWRTGIVLDPFGGSGTTLEAAQIVGRHAIGIDLDERNAHLAQERVGMFLTITERTTG